MKHEFFKMEHKFYDKQILDVICMSSPIDPVDNTCLLSFINKTSGVSIRKDDFIALANYFGLVVYEKGSALEVKNESQ